MDDREQVNRAAADHVARMRQRLDEGQAEIERQQASIGDTREHMAGMQRWIGHDERSRSQDDRGDS